MASAANFKTNLPYGEAALRKPDVKWNVSGLFSHDDFILKFIELVTEKLDCPVNPIASIHGCPPVLWNGGRFTRFMGQEEINNILKQYEKLHLPMYLTFSNYMLEPEHLKDHASNWVLDRIADTENAGIIIANDTLKDYIKSKYPNLKMITSLVKTAVRNAPTSQEYYEDLAKDSDMVVIHPDDTFNYPLLETLHHKNKFELMVNENCIYGCKVRYLHYSFYHTSHKVDVNIADKNHNFEATACLALHHRKQNLVGVGQPNFSRTRNCNVTEDEFDYLYDIGYRHFKIQGRSDPAHAFMYDLCRFTLEKDFVAPLVFQTVMS